MLRACEGEKKGGRQRGREEEERGQTWPIGQEKSHSRKKIRSELLQPVPRQEGGLKVQ